MHQALRGTLRACLQLRVEASPVSFFPSVSPWREPIDYALQTKKRTIQRTRDKKREAIIVTETGRLENGKFNSRYWLDATEEPGAETGEETRVFGVFLPWPES